MIFMRLLILLLLVGFSAAAETVGNITAGGPSLIGTVGSGEQASNPLSAFVGVSGMVIARYGAGIACVAGDYCASGICLHGICRSSFPYCSDNFCDIGENCNSCPQDCGVCMAPAQTSSQQSLLNAVNTLERAESEILRMVNASTLDVLNRQIEELALEGRLDAVKSRLNQAYAVSYQVYSGAESDAYLLSRVLLSDSVPELGLELRDIGRGKEALLQAGLLLKQAANETNPVRKAGLLKEAIMQELTVLESLPEVSEVFSVFDSPSVTASEASEALKSASTPAARDAISSITPNSDIALVRSLHLYKLTNLEKGQKQAFRSRITLTVNSAANISNLRMVEVIPKSVAADCRELVFSVSPEVLQGDPVVSWSWQFLPARSSVNVSYVAKAGLSELKGRTLASGETVAANPGQTAVCGDDRCGPGENPENCPQDCRLRCAKKITPAVSPSGECREFLSPCEVPSGWSRVLSCALPAREGVDKVILLVFLIIFSALVLVVMRVTRSPGRPGSGRGLGWDTLSDIKEQLKGRIMRRRRAGLHDAAAGEGPLEFFGHGAQKGGFGAPAYVRGGTRSGKEDRAGLHELDRRIREELEKLEEDSAGS